MKTQIYHKYNGEQFNGVRAITLVDMENGWGKIPKGTNVTLGRKTNQAFSIKSDPCLCCGVEMKMSNVSYRDVDLIEDVKPYKRMKCADAFGAWR